MPCCTWTPILFCGRLVIATGGRITQSVLLVSEQYTMSHLLNGKNGLPFFGFASAKVAIDFSRLPWRTKRPKGNLFSGWSLLQVGVSRVCAIPILVYTDTSHIWNPQSCERAIYGLCRTSALTLSCAWLLETGRRIMSVCNACATHYLHNPSIWLQSKIRSLLNRDLHYILWAIRASGGRVMSMCNPYTQSHILNHQGNI